MTKVLNEDMRSKALSIMDKFFLHCSSPNFYESTTRTTTPASWIVLSMDVDGSQYKAALEYHQAIKEKRKEATFSEALHKRTPVGRIAFNVDEHIHISSAGPYSPCHGMFPNLPNNDKLVVGSNFDYLPGEDYAHKYLSYLVDPKLSPYRSLLQYGYNIHYNSEGHTAGISLFVEDIPVELRHTIKNFFIACRMARECKEFTKQFCNMVDDGLDPRFAHLLMAQAKRTTGKRWRFGRSAKNMGHHWPISLGNNDGGFDIARFFHSDLKPLKSFSRVNALFNPDNITNTLAQRELESIVAQWSDSLKTRFAPVENEGIIVKLDTLNELLFNHFKEKKGISL